MMNDLYVSRLLTTYLINTIKNPIVSIFQELAKHTKDELELKLKPTKIDKNTIEKSWIESYRKGLRTVPTWKQSLQENTEKQQTKLQGAIDRITTAFRKQNDQILPSTLIETIFKAHASQFTIQDATFPSFDKFIHKTLILVSEKLITCLNDNIKYDSFYVDRHMNIIEDSIKEAISLSLPIDTIITAYNNPRQYGGGISPRDKDSIQPYMPTQVVQSFNGIQKGGKYNNQSINNITPSKKSNLGPVALQMINEASIREGSIREGSIKDDSFQSLQQIKTQAVNIPSKNMHKSKSFNLDENQCRYDTLQLNNSLVDSDLGSFNSKKLKYREENQKNMSNYHRNGGKHRSVSLGTSPSTILDTFGTLNMAQLANSSPRKTA